MLAIKPASTCKEVINNSKTIQCLSRNCGITSAFLNTPLLKELWPTFDVHEIGFKWPRALKSHQIRSSGWYFNENPVGDLTVPTRDCSGSWGLFWRETQRRNSQVANPCGGKEALTAGSNQVSQGWWAGSAARLCHKLSGLGVSQI